MLRQKQKKPKSPMLRQLKTYSKYRHRETLRDCTVPELRFRGHWLAAASFTAGGHVEIEVGESELTIKMEKS